MSYLPHESKTYKEPEEPVIEEPRELTFQNLPPASSLLQENASSPEMMLKHYSYHPHPPPMLPGPSVHEDVAMIERLAAARRKRSQEAEGSKMTVKEAESVDTQKILSFDVIPEATTSVVTPRPVKEESLTSRKLKHNSSSKSNTAVKKKSSKKLTETKKKSPPDKKDEYKVNYCFVNDVVPKKLEEANSKKILSKPKKVLGSHITYEDQVLVSDKSAQCVPEDEGILKLTIIPSVVHSLTQALSLLIHELKEESPNDANAVENLENILTSLSNYKVETDFSFEVTFSDARRLDEICKDVSKYLEEAYGASGKFGKYSEVKKKLFGELFERDYELDLLTDKAKNIKFEEVDLNDYEFDNPEVELQNKILENEQLRAKIEFNYMKFRRFHKALADNDWEIKKSQEEVSTLKKLLAKEEKTESSSKTSTDSKTRDKKKQTK